MTGRKIGIAIGINDYLDPKLSNLLFAKKDAEELRAVLLNPDIGGFDEIVPLVNETKYNVNKGIEKLLLKDATYNDLVIIYFSGHGKLNAKFELNLLLKDTETDYLSSTALHYNFITDCIEESKCKKVIIILDCCHGGAAGIKGDISKTLSDTSGSGIFILSATTGSNLAKEVQELENGIFTYFILEGLRKGDADLGGDGLIDIIELFEYASKRCNNDYSQVATIKSKFEERIVIGKNPLKIKEKKFEINMRELVKLRKALSVKLYDESMTILLKDNKNPLSLTNIEVEIKDHLFLLLSGEIKIGTYVHTIQYLKSEEYIESVLKEESLIFKPEDKQITPLYSLSPKNLTLVEDNSDIPKNFTSPSTGMELVLIPAGKFMMGSPSGDQERYDDEGPVHEVIIKNPFYVGKYPVTQKQWEKIMGSNPSKFRGEDRPVESVSWNDVQEFIKKLNEKESAGKYRLPSESEWEYACRAGTTTRYSFGDDESKLDDYAWYSENSGSETHPVGQNNPNPWGLYDIHGNVWEWCQDNWHGNYDGAPSDGSAWESGSGSDRVDRGGSWSIIARVLPVGGPH